MTAPRMSWTQPICEECWLQLESEVNGDEVKIRMPVRLREPQVEECSYCGHVTIFGVYKRDDPAKVPYPKAKKEDS